jgi:MFS-type transporter involved in bile tolerance (Atg22 family)
VDGKGGLMRETFEWGIFGVYGLFLAVMGHFGLQHTRFLLFLALLFGMSLTAILGFSILRAKYSNSGCRERGQPQSSGK